MVLLVVQPGIPDQDILLGFVKDNVEIVYYNKDNKITEYANSTHRITPNIHQNDNSEMSLKEKVSQHNHVGFIWNNGNNKQEIPFEGFSELLHDNLTVDLITCNLNSSDFRKYIQEIENSFTNLNIRYSINKTGNTQEQLVESDNADWIMESDNVSIKDIYFTDDISMYHSTLDTNNIYKYSKRVTVINKDDNGTITNQVTYYPISSAFNISTSYVTYYAEGTFDKLTTDILNGASELHITLRDIKEIPNNSFDELTNISEIIIPKNVKSIGYRAFHKCGLTRVTFETDSELENIGYDAFSLCNISEIEIPRNVKSIGDSAFYNNNELTSITFESGSQLETIEYGVFNECDIKKITIPQSVKSIGNNAFYKNLNLTDVTFESESQLETIGINGFYECNINEIEIPKLVKSIGNNAFYNNSNLTSVTFESGSTLEKIGWQAFKDCNIKTITIPKTVRTIEFNAFWNNVELTSVTFESESTLEKIEDTVFRECNISEIEIPKSVIIIENNAFLNNSNLTNVTFESGSTLETIGSSAFKDCNISETIIIPKSLKTISGSAFYNNNELTSITFETDSELENIGNNAFSLCNIGEIEIPKNVKSIGDGAFYRHFSNSNANFIKVTFESESQLETIGYNTFFVNDDIIIPKSIKTLHTNSFVFYNNENGNVTFQQPPAEFDLLYSEDSGFLGRLYNVDGELPDNIEVIYNKTHVIGNSNIDNNIYTINIPSIITSIPNNYASTSIFINDISQGNTIGIKIIFEENSKIKTIGESAFAGTDASYPAKSFTIYSHGLTIPESVTTIGKNSFAARTEYINISELSENRFDQGYSYALNPTYNQNDIPTYLSYFILDNVLTVTNVITLDNDETKTIIFPSNIIKDLIEAWNTYYQDDNNKPKITTLKIGEGITYIDFDTFKSLNSSPITSIEIPASVTDIKEKAFINVSQLTSVTFEPGSELETIGSEAFNGSNIETITIPKLVKSIGDFAFNNNSNLTSVTFEPGSELETIGSEAFSGSNIETITIPKLVKSIGDFAFNNNSNLTSVTFESGSTLETIGSSAFKDCNISETIIIPKLVKSIGDSAFYNNNELTSITFESGSQLETIEYGVFNECDIKKITIPKLVKSIGDFAFNKNLNLTDVTFEPGSQLERIANSVFRYCNISEIEIPKSVKSIGDYAFYSNRNLTRVTFELESQLETIGTYGLFNCSISEIEIPQSVKTIGDFAFFYNKSLTNVTFESGESGSKLETIGTYGLSVCNISQIEIPQSVKSIGDSAFYFNRNLTRVTFESGEPESQLERIANSVFRYCNISEIEIPQSVKSIGDFAFSNNHSLTSVTFEPGSQLEEIGNSAFVTTGIVQIKIPDSVNNLGSCVFCNCIQLTSIYGNLPNIKEIPIDFAYASSKLEFVECLSQYNNIELINIYSFFNCNLKMDVIIGSPTNQESNVSYIGGNSFPYNSNLKNITVYNSDGFGGNWYYGETKLSVTINNLSGYLKKNVFDNIKNLYIMKFDSSIMIEDEIFVSFINKYKEDGNELQTYNPVESNKKIFNGYGYSSNISKNFDLNILDFIPTPFTRYFDPSRTNIDISESNITVLYQNTFENLDLLQYILLPEGLERIEDRCFNNCSSLRSINFPRLLETIGFRAFSGCSSITSISIPKNVTRIHGKAFEGVSITKYTREMDDGSEKTINLQDPNLDNALSGFDYTYSNFDQYKDYISEVTDEDGINVLGYKFTPPSGWSGLYDVKLTNLFNLYQQNDKNIIEIDIPNDYSFIDDFSLESCYTIETVNLPDTISYIGREAFSLCYNLHQSSDNPLKLPSGSVTLRHNCFISTSNICLSYHNEGSYITETSTGGITSTSTSTISIRYQEEGIIKSFDITKKNPDFTKFIDPDNRIGIRYTLPSIFGYYDYDNENDDLESKYGTFIEQRNDVGEQEEYKFNVPSHWKYMPDMNLYKFINAFNNIGKQITEIVLPNHFTHFDGYAIYMLQSDVNITKLNLPDSISRLGFSSVGYTYVEELEIPNNLINIVSSSISLNIGTILNFKNSSNIENIVDGTPSFLNYNIGRTLFVDNIEQQLEDDLNDNLIITLGDNIEINMFENTVYQLPQFSSIYYKIEEPPTTGKYADGHYQSTTVGTDSFTVALYFNNERMGTHIYNVTVSERDMELNDIHDIDFNPPGNNSGPVLRFIPKPKLGAKSAIGKPVRLNRLIKTRC